MPIYEYVCKDCQAHFEVFSTSAASAAASVVKCKECGSVKVVKTISATSLRVGSGGGGVPGGAFSGCSSQGGFK